MSKKAATSDAASVAPAAGTSGNPVADPVSRFESSLTELEAIVARMERGDLPLEESLSLFERGMKLSKDCRVSLETAELRIKNLLDPDDSGAPPA